MSGSFNMDYSGSADPMGGSGSGGGGGGGRKNYDSQTLIPVTIRMLLNAVSTSNSGGGTGSLALSDGRELHQIKLVGAVRSFEEQSTNASFQMEDGTGLIDVKQWLDAGDCAAVAEMRARASTENVYVRVVGQLKDYENKKSVVGYSVRVVSSGNELTHHMLEVVYSHERFQRKEQGVAGAVAQPQAAHTPYSSYSNTHAPFNRQPLQPQAGLEGGSAVQRAVLHYIQTEGETDSGADINVCIQALAGQFGEQEIRQTAEFLASEGHIYSTINDSRYKYAS